jgi:integrase
VKALSTGTTDTSRANAIAAMVRDFHDSRNQWEWLDLAVAGKVTLDKLYTHHANGSLDELRAQRDAAEKAAADADLSAWVGRWAETDRVHGLLSLPLRPRTRDAYVTHVRWFLPADKVTPMTSFTEAYVKQRLSELPPKRKDGVVASATQRRYLISLQQFLFYLAPRVQLPEHPLANAWGRRGWAPKNGKPRMTVYEHDKVLAVLDQLDGEYRAAVALVFGSGIELSALVAMHGADVGSDAERTIVAHGTKNGAREDRTIFVDEWAWRIFAPHAKTILPRGRVWSAPEPKPGTPPDWPALRSAFYWAQVRAGYVAEPPVDEDSGKRQWGRVNPHRIHDARHSYAVNRSLGLDGEPPQGLDYLVQQLGHVDETMLARIYKKQTLAQRGERLKLQRTQQAAQAAGVK